MDEILDYKKDNDAMVIMAIFTRGTPQEGGIYAFCERMDQHPGKLSRM